MLMTLSDTGGSIGFGIVGFGVKIYILSIFLSSSTLGKVSNCYIMSFPKSILKVKPWLVDIVEVF
jgi:hypothetical protein